MRVLVVEDQAELADDIADGLRDQGIAADIAYEGSSAIEKAMMTTYDVVVLDRDLPRIHGDAVCASLVGSPSPARILMLTAAGTVGDRVDGLNLGADDYLTKPFAFAELVARVRALARRQRPNPAPGQPGRHTHHPDPQRARCARGADGGRRRRDQRGGPARARLGRER
jgi:DNA-binding response OmpR family regulator